MSWHFRNVVFSGRSLLRRLEEARREGELDQVRALRDRCAETRRALAGMLEESESEIEEARQVLRELEGQEGRAA